MKTIKFFLVVATILSVVTFAPSVIAGEAGKAKADMPMFQAYRADPGGGGS